jgi:hypothetical protein
MSPPLTWLCYFNCQFHYIVDGCLYHYIQQKLINVIVKISKFEISGADFHTLLTCLHFIVILILLTKSQALIQNLIKSQILKNTKNDKGNFTTALYTDLIINVYLLR